MGDSVDDRSPGCPLDLEVMVANIYDLVGCDLVVDDSRPPLGSLSSEDAAWLTETVRK